MPRPMPRSSRTRPERTSPATGTGVDLTSAAARRYARTPYGFAPARSRRDANASSRSASSGFSRSRGRLKSACAERSESPNRGIRRGHSVDMLQLDAFYGRTCRRDTQWRPCPAAPFSPAGDRRAGEHPPPLTLAEPPDEQGDALATSYRRLSDVFHHLLSEQSLDALLDRIFDAVSDLVPCDTLTIYQVDEARRLLVPLTARDRWAEEIMDSNLPFGQGITGWAVENGEPALVNQAHLDPRLDVVPGTPPDEQESLIVVPLVSRGVIMGALNVYRLGEHASFSEREFELVQRCGDAAALALDNAQIREKLERQAQTDSLTGLYNHRFFHDRLRAELSRSSRAHESLAVVMLDIDDFKKVNDVFGHGTGDQILVALADVLRFEHQDIGHRLQDRRRGVCRDHAGLHGSRRTWLRGAGDRAPGQDGIRRSGADHRLGRRVRRVPETR